MTLARVSLGPAGFELRTFDCSSCHHVEKVAIASDPMKSGDVGWLAAADMTHIVDTVHMELVATVHMQRRSTVLI